MPMKTFIIAEAASAHDGNLQKAVDLVQVAARAGADAFKVQYWSDPDRLADRRRVPPHYREVYRQYAVPAVWLPVLAVACETAGVEFMCTTFLPGDVATVDPFVHRHKVSSFEAADLGLLQEVMALGKPVIVSTGMCQPVEIGDIIDTWARDGDGELTLMHCISAYPAAVEHLHLDVLRQVYRGHRSGHTHPMTGYSDHSGLVDVGAWAVAAGATVVEVHMRLANTTPSNPDAGSFAFPPSELLKYIGRIRKVEVALGSSGVVATSAGRMVAEAPMAAYRVVAK
jgi:N,N'-diacetyllegionaminate synthase